MANVNSAMGLRAAKHFNGGVVRLSEYQIASAYNTSIFSGDLVKVTGTTKQIAQSAANDRSVGVFYGCQYQDTAGNLIFSRYWPASTTVLTGSTTLAWVYDDPRILFEVQASTSLAAADIGTTGDVVVGTGSTTTGTSAGQLDTTGLATSGTKNLKVVQLVNRPDNAFGTNAKVHVLIAKHEYAADIIGS